MIGRPDAFRVSSSVRIKMQTETVQTLTIQTSVVHGPEHCMLSIIFVFFHGNP